MSDSLILMISFFLICWGLREEWEKDKRQEELSQKIAEKLKNKTS